MLVDDFGFGFNGEMGRGDIGIKSWLLPYLFVLSIKFVYLNDKISDSVFIVFLLSFVEALIEVRGLFLILQFFAEGFDFTGEYLNLFVIVLPDDVHGGFDVGLGSCFWHGV